MSCCMPRFECVDKSDACAAPAAWDSAAVACRDSSRSQGHLLISRSCGALHESEDPGNSWGHGRRLLGKLRVTDDAAGFQDLLHLLAEHGDTPDDPIPIAIETSRGLMVACLRAAGRRVFAINPMAVARYRDRHTVSRKKSDHQDAVVLANILRTDAQLHRPLPGDSELVKAIAVLARAQQDAVWDRTRAHNRLRSHLREYYPAVLEAFADKRERLLAREARAILAIAPTQAEAAKLARSKVKAAVTQAGRQRRIEAETDRLLKVLRHSARLHSGSVQ